MINQPWQKDNSTFEQKLGLRIRTLAHIERPIVMETHGGTGKLFNRCYRHLQEGVVFEAEATKAGILARQRPTWAVYEVNVEKALPAGVGSHLEVNFLDVDPYGEPWPTLDGYFGSERMFPPKMAVVVNDGLRQKLRMNGGWAVQSMHDVCKKYGNAALYHNYLSISKELVSEKAARCGYRLTHWAGYYCGAGGNMTHFAAVFEK
jgi:hypothetical protein